MRRWATAAFLALVGCGPAPVALPPPARPLVPTAAAAIPEAPPPPGERRALARPELYEARLDNGLWVIVWPRQEARVTAVRYVTRRGGEDGPRSFAGRSWMVGRTLYQALSAPGTDEAPSLADLGVEVDVGVGFDSASVTVETTPERLVRVVAVLAHALRWPRLGLARVEAAREDTIERIARSRRSAERAAVHWARGMLYGFDHRASLPLWGDRDVVRDVTETELMALHHIAWGPSDAALVVVGDVDPEAVREVADRALGGWRVEPPPRLPREPWMALDSAEVARALGLRSGASRSLVLLAERAPARTSPDYAAFRVLTEVMGGMGSSRLDRRLERQCPSCSGVEALYDARLEGGELMFSVEVDRRRVAGVLEELTAELERVIDEGPSEAEVEAARARVRSELASRLESSAAAVGLVGDLFVLGTGVAELERLEGAVAEVSAAEVQEVAASWLRPERAAVVVTGTPDIVSLAFSRASIGPAVFRRPR